ncbi:LPS export ABC transporter periplasmic protein LptC [Acinetobacter johnsonii]|uniref:LPS export ABC transporter periplasmic protein LptC n=1 Tax=Acinetobacter johnsonii TaxID=40214 RepID=UPI00244B728C|nr:LPS export ABC transporter periplasmic protein LptC [Acinetobacter johnsonii]MDH1488917.1 LPS export ABC transporter periplasmic protein LptC [Acinetobacter johnsonii]MDH1614849.1 LPS export ABC transporter periplasmic protein LptC [Acinetobacter johnsonii]
MDTKVLYITAVAIAAISSGYYYYSGKGQKLEVDGAQSMTYSAEQIQLTQTDEQGNLYVRAKVDRLEQEMQKKTSKLENLNAEMYKDGKVDVTFYAKQANGINDNEKVVLTNQVVAKKMLDQGQMQFETAELIAFPQTRELESQHQVVVTTPQAEFVSQGLKANLNTGQYDFFHIRGKYEP